MKTLLFIPCYNCQEQIPRVVSKLKVLSPSDVTEILFVDNVSEDETLSSILESIDGIQIPISVFQNRENYGLGGSHKVAIKYALENEFDHFIVLHGDDQGDIQDVLPMLRMRELYDCILGARFHKCSQLKNYSYFRTFGNRILNRIFSWLSRKEILDLGSGLNLYRTEIFRNGFHKKFSDDLTFNYQLILANIYQRHRILFFPITWREEDQVTNVKLFRQALRTLMILGSFLYSKKNFMEKEHRKNGDVEYTYKLVRRVTSCF